MTIKAILSCMDLYMFALSRFETLNNKQWNNLHSRR